MLFCCLLSCCCYTFFICSKNVLTVDMNCGLKVHKVIILKNVTYVHLFLLFQNKFLQKLIIDRKKWKIHVKIPLQDTIHTFMIMM